MNHPDSTPVSSPGHAASDAPADSVMLSLRGVSKEFHGTAVVRDVDLEVQRGEVVSIIGPSGAGKSTLLRCVNYLEIPTRGVLWLDGVEITAGAGKGNTLPHRNLARLRRDVGMVFQGVNLFPHLTVLRNVAMPQERVLGVSRKEAEARARELLARFGVDAKADAYPAKCSGGQQQRVAIARALSLNPKVMLFDEATSALDPELGLEVLGVMRKLAADGMTMVVVTHEIHFAEDVSDRVVVMADGAILEQGPPADLLKKPRHERTQRFLRAVRERA